MEEFQEGPILKPQKGFDKGAVLTIIFTLIVIVLFWVVFTFTSFLGKQEAPTETSGGPGSCLILEEKYCQEVRTYEIDTNGTIGAVFNVPDGTQIFMPFDGAYFDESPGADDYAQIKLGIPDTDSFLIIVVEYEPHFVDGSGISKGEIFATTINNEVTGEKQENDFNLVIYGQNFDIATLFTK